MQITLQQENYILIKFQMKKKNKIYTEVCQSLIFLSVSLIEQEAFNVTIRIVFSYTCMYINLLQLMYSTH